MVIDSRNINGQQCFSLSCAGELWETCWWKKKRENGKQKKKNEKALFNADLLLYRGLKRNVNTRVQ